MKVDYFPTGTLLTDHDVSVAEVLAGLPYELKTYTVSSGAQVASAGGTETKDLTEANGKFWELLYFRITVTPITGGAVGNHKIEVGRYNPGFSPIDLSCDDDSNNYLLYSDGGWHGATGTEVPASSEDQAKLRNWMYVEPYRSLRMKYTNNSDTASNNSRALLIYVKEYTLPT